MGKNGKDAGMGGGQPIPMSVSLSLRQGTYAGSIISSNPERFPCAVQAFRGIPYAESTAGANRFKPPKALVKDRRSPGVADGTAHDASKYGHVCPQGGLDKGQGEDCLNLDVFRPHHHDKSRGHGGGRLLPIVIYVHGGGFNYGNGHERDLASFVSWASSPSSGNGNDLIAIGFNYRVGALGFLSGNRAERAGLLNLGLRDQQCLFEWVTRNARDLGGDERNITVMGLSAGAHSIGHHLMSYAPINNITHQSVSQNPSGRSADPVALRPPPFQKAIIESGAPTARAVLVPSHPLHEQQFEEFLTHCGLTSDKSDKSHSSNEADAALFASLRELPLNVVASASHKVWQQWGPTLRWPFQPVIDGPGGLVPDLPIRCWKSSPGPRGSRVLRIPILTGFNTHEGATFVQSHPAAASSAPLALRNMMSSLVPGFKGNPEHLETLERLYPSPATLSDGGRSLYHGDGNDDALDWSSHIPPMATPNGCGDQFWRLQDAYAHYAYICPVLQTAHYASSSASANAPPVYVYQYAARSPLRGAAEHGDEAPIVAHRSGTLRGGAGGKKNKGSPPPPGKAFPGLTAVADHMTGYWASFISSRDGDVNYYSTGVSSPAQRPEWPRFLSPFTTADLEQQAQSSPRGNNNNNKAGQIIVFGRGNDERRERGRGGSNGLSSSPPVTVQTLSSRQRAQCAYWWPRVVYSQGWGDGGGNDMESQTVIQVEKGEKKPLPSRLGGAKL